MKTIEKTAEQEPTDCCTPAEKAECCAPEAKETCCASVVDEDAPAVRSTCGCR
jgi:hypothetical protein